MAGIDPRLDAVDKALRLYRVTREIIERKPRLCLQGGRRGDTSGEQVAISEEVYRRFEEKAKELLEKLEAGERVDHKLLEEYAGRIAGDNQELQRRLTRGFNCIRSLYACEMPPRRAASLASLASQDIIDAILFYVSKADPQRYRSIYNLVEAAGGQQLSPTGDDVETLSRECRDDGYSLVLALLAHGLPAILGADRRLPELKDLVELVLEKARDGTLYHNAQYILDYLLALKRTLEGHYPS